MAKTNNNLVATLRAQGFRGEGLRTAYAIAMRESSGRADAYNPNRATGDDSYGLFQINMLGDLGPSRRKQYGLKSNRDLLDPATNARVAYAMSKGGTDFGAWAVGKNAYRQMSPAERQRFETYRNSFPGAGATTPTQHPATSQQPASAASDRSGLLLELLQRRRARRGEGDSPLLRLLAQRSTPSAGRPAVGQTPARTAPAAEPREAGGSPGGIREAFYDPLGAYDEGKWINPIGGHSDHVHVSFGTPDAAMEAIRKAKAMGLRASENPYAEGSPAEKGVHTDTSYHYQSFPGVYEGGLSPTLGRGLDVSGDPAKMAAFFKWVRSRWGL